MSFTETNLQQHLSRLRSRLLLMCQAVGEALDGAGRVLLTYDRDLAEKVVASDAAIDALEDEIDEMALSILALHQPVARDLRFVIGALRIVVNLERLGDEASVIAERVLFVLREGGDRLPMPREAVVLLKESQKAYTRAVQALTEESCIGSLQLFEHAESTQAEVAMLHRVLEEHQKNNQTYSMSASLQLILVARVLNRTWRLSDNILKQVWFICKGESIKHRRSPLR